MKKIFRKSNIFSFLLGAIIFGGITGVAAYSIFADNIGYTPSDTTWKKANGEAIENVKDAIDELYTKASQSQVNNIKFLNSNGIVGTAISNRKASINLSKGKYLIVFSEFSAMCADCGRPSISITSANDVTIENFTELHKAQSSTYSAKNYLKLVTIDARENCTINVVSNDGATHNSAAAGLSYIVIEI